jgi:3-mercaptopyruvate sulfurtransferase SseA
MQGFKNVKNMGGGYLAWIDHGFPVHGISSSSSSSSSSSTRRNQESLK